MQNDAAIDCSKKLDTSDQISMALSGLAAALEDLPEEAHERTLIPIPAKNLMSLSDQAYRFNYLVAITIAIESKLSSAPDGYTRTNLLGAIGNFLIAFTDILRLPGGIEPAFSPSFIYMLMGEIANLQKGIPSKLFALDGANLGENPSATSHQITQAFAAAFLRRLMDFDGKFGRQKNGRKLWRRKLQTHSKKEGLREGIQDK